MSWLKRWSKKQLIIGSSGLAIFLMLILIGLSLFFPKGSQASATEEKETTLPASITFTSSTPTEATADLEGRPDLTSYWQELQQARQEGKLVEQEIEAAWAPWLDDTDREELHQLSTAWSHIEKLASLPALQQQKEAILSRLRQRQQEQQQKEEQKPTAATEETFSTESTTNSVSSSTSVLSSTSSIPPAYPAVTGITPEQWNALSPEQKGEWTPVLIIGDSLTYGLKKFGFFDNALPYATVDGVGSRLVTTGKEIYQQHVAAGWDGTAVIFALGTNGRISEAGLEDLIATVPNTKAVILVTVHSPYTNGTANNELYYQAAQRHANVSIADWYQLSQNHPNYFGEDNIHLTWDGDAAYLGMLREALTNLYR